MKTTHPSGHASLSPAHKILDTALRTIIATQTKFRPYDRFGPMRDDMEYVPLPLPIATSIDNDNARDAPHGNGLAAGDGDDGNTASGARGKGDDGNTGNAAAGDSDASDTAPGQMEIFLVRFKPGAASTPHEHTGGEAFYVLEGELVDCDDTILRRGDYVCYQPGSRHYSVSQKGCTLLVLLGGSNTAVTADAP